MNRVLDPERYVDGTRRPTGLLTRLGGSAGQGLFYSKASSTLISSCITVIGTKSDGSQTDLYRDQGCYSSKVRWHLYGDGLYHPGVNNLINLYHQNKKPEEAETLKKGIYEYYCLDKKIDSIKYHWTKLVESNGKRLLHFQRSDHYDCKSKNIKGDI